MKLLNNFKALYILLGVFFITFLSYSQASQSEINKVNKTARKVTITNGNRILSIDASFPNVKAAFFKNRKPSNKEIFTIYNLSEKRSESGFEFMYIIIRDQKGHFLANDSGKLVRTDFKTLKQGIESGFTQLVRVKNKKTGKIQILNRPGIKRVALKSNGTANFSGKEIILSELSSSPKQFVHTVKRVTNSSSKSINAKFEEEKELNSQIISFPNPVNGNFLNLNLENQPKVRNIEILNILGQKVLNYVVSEAEKKIALNVSHINNGIYILSINASKIDKPISKKVYIMR